MTDTAWKTHLEHHLRGYYGGALGLPPEQVERAIHDRITLRRGRTFAALLNSEVPLAGQHLLDVGAGWGETLLSCLEFGADAYGVEPDPDEVEITRMLLRANEQDDTRATVGVAEHLPYADDTFDIVSCQQVLEHVADVDRAAGELVRVTKPGGYLCVSHPNYLFPYEGHYRMKWLPGTPKRLGALVLRAKGRDPRFLLEHVNYVTYPGMFRRWRRLGVEVRNITDERARSGQHPSRFYKGRVGQVVLALRLYPNVTWLLRKSA